MEFSNLDNPRNTKSGISTIVYLAPVSWFSDIKKPAGSSPVITDSHLFKYGKGFLQFVLAPQKNKFDGKMAGDLGSNFLGQGAEVFIPGSYAEAFAVLNSLINRPLIALVKDSDCAAGFYYNLGCDCLGTWLTTNFSTATTKDGAKGFVATLQTDCSGIVMYTGDLTTYTNVVAGYPPPITSEDGQIITTEDGFNISPEN